MINNESLNGKTIIVVGGNGFIGSNFIRSVFTRYPEVRIVNIDKNTYAGNPNNLNDIRESSKKRGGGYDFVEQQDDIANPDISLKTVVGWWRPNFVVNFAAETHVDRSIHGDKQGFINTNIIGVYNLLEAIKDSGVEKFIQISSDEIFGQLPIDSDKKFTRNSPIDPSSLYSATKASGDLLCGAYYRTWGVPVIITRCSNNYGPYQYPEKLIPYWTMLLSRGEKMPMYGDGLNIRDWIHVDDHGDAIIACLLRGEPGKVYNIGANNERSNIEIARLVAKIMFGSKAGEDWENKYVKKVVDRPGHDRRYAIDNTDTVNELGWTPVVTFDEFEEKLKDTVLWFMNNQEWVNESIRRGGANVHINS